MWPLSLGEQLGPRSVWLLVSGPGMPALLPPPLDAVVDPSGVRGGGQERPRPLRAPLIGALVDAAALRAMVRVPIGRGRADAYGCRQA